MYNPQIHWKSGPSIPHSEISEYVSTEDLELMFFTQLLSSADSSSCHTNTERFQYIYGKLCNDNLLEKRPKSPIGKHQQPPRAAKVSGGLKALRDGICNNLLERCNKWRGMTWVWAKLGTLKSTVQTGNFDLGWLNLNVAFSPSAPGAQKFIDIATTHHTSFNKTPYTSIYK